MTRDLSDIIDEMRSEDAATMTPDRARTYARAAYAGYGGWFHQMHWRDTDNLTRYRDEARRAAAAMQADIDATQARLDATRVLLDLLDEAIDDPAPASPVDPMPAGNPAAPGPSLAGLERAAGEGGGSGTDNHSTTESE